MKKLLIVAALAVGACSYAQNNPVSLDVRGGIAFPASGDLSGTFWGLGADFTLDRSLLNRGQTFISADWITKSTKVNRRHMFNFALNQRFELNPISDTNPNRTYGFLGVGAAILDFGTSATVLSARGGLGMDFSPNIFGEVSYVITTRGKGHNRVGNHIGLYLGYRM